MAACAAHVASSVLWSQPSHDNHRVCAEHGAMCFVMWSPLAHPTASCLMEGRPQAVSSQSEDPLGGLLEAAWSLSSPWQPSSPANTLGRVRSPLHRKRRQASQTQWLGTDHHSAQPPWQAALP